MEFGRDRGALRIVHEELDRLSDLHRQAIVLCDLEALTHEQAAARLGCPVGTVEEPPGPRP